jgi:hypothetical protein
MTCFYGILFGPLFWSIDGLIMLIDEYTISSSPGFINELTINLGMTCFFGLSFRYDFVKHPRDSSLSTRQIVVLFSFPLFLMDNSVRRNNRQWKVLYWNIRGINSVAKWTALRSKIAKTNYDIVCVQETKRPSFHQAYL